MKIRPIDWIIHGFALLHVAVNVVCSLMGIPDSMFLTALTMALAVIICYRENLTVEITVMALILVNTMGFILGNVGAQVLVDIFPAPWQHAFTTFLVTEILGWSLYIFAHRISPYGAAGYERDQSWYENAGWLVTAIAIVFGLRLYIGHFYTGNLLLENSGALMVLILTTLLALLFMINSAIRMRRELRRFWRWQMSLRHPRIRGPGPVRKPACRSAVCGRTGRTGLEAAGFLSGRTALSGREKLACGIERMRFFPA